MNGNSNAQRLCIVIEGYSKHHPHAGYPRRRSPAHFPPSYGSSPKTPRSESVKETHHQTLTNATSYDRLYCLLPLFQLIVEVYMYRRVPTSPELE